MFRQSAYIIPCKNQAALGETAMARLEELVSPTELLREIRTGLTKDHVVKKYKTSEKDLAAMLHSLYRAKELSVEEFNNFFKGLPLAPKKAAAEETQELLHRGDDESPSAILKSLSDAHDAKAASDKLARTVAPEEKPKPPAPKPEPLESASPEPAPSVAAAREAEEEEIDEEDFLEEAELIEEPDVEAADLLEDIKKIDAEEARELAPPPIVEQETPPVAWTDSAAVEAVAPDPQGTPEPEPAAVAPNDVAGSLQAILAKLTSIDAHLARIDDKLTNR
jgi:hypothetical protein